MSLTPPPPSTSSLPPSRPPLASSVTSPASSQGPTTESLLPPATMSSPPIPELPPAPQQPAARPLLPPSPPSSLFDASPSEQLTPSAAATGESPREESCIVSGIGSAVTGVFMGGLIGLGTGAWKTRSFKGAISEAGTNVRSFAIMGGLYSLVVCYMRKMRGTEDALNSGVAGCATGMALAIGGGPSSALQGCAGFGIFSFLLDLVNPPPARGAVTGTSSSTSSHPSRRAQRMGFESRVRDSLKNASSRLSQRNGSRESDANRMDELILCIASRVYVPVTRRAEILLKC